MTTIIKGELQIDFERGVIYFHTSVEAQEAGFCPTPIRICGLGRIGYPLNDRQIDLTVRPLVVQDHQLYEVKIVGVK